MLLHELLEGLRVFFLVSQKGLEFLEARQQLAAQIAARLELHPGLHAAGARGVLQRVVDVLQDAEFEGVREAPRLGLRVPVGDAGHAEDLVHDPGVLQHVVDDVGLQVGLLRIGLAAEVAVGEGGRPRPLHVHAMAFRRVGRWLLFLHVVLVEVRPPATTGLRRRGPSHVFPLRTFSTRSREMWAGVADGREASSSTDRTPWLGGRLPLAVRSRRPGPRCWRPTSGTTAGTAPREESASGLRRPPGGDRTSPPSCFG